MTGLAVSGEVIIAADMKGTIMIIRKGVVEHQQTIEEEKYSTGGLSAYRVSKLRETLFVVSGARGKLFTLEVLEDLKVSLKPFNTTMSVVH